MKGGGERRDAGCVGVNCILRFMFPQITTHTDMHRRTPTRVDINEQSSIIFSPFLLPVCVSASAESPITDPEGDGDGVPTREGPPDVRGRIRVFARDFSRVRSRSSQIN